jgi:hypothetical protein
VLGCARGGDDCSRCRPVRCQIHSSVGLTPRWAASHDSGPPVESPRRSWSLAGFRFHAGLRAPRRFSAGLWFHAGLRAPRRSFAGIQFRLHGGRAAAASDRRGRGWRLHCDLEPQSSNPPPSFQAAGPGLHGRRAAAARPPRPFLAGEASNSTRLSAPAEGALRRSTVSFAPSGARSGR